MSDRPKVLIWRGSRDHFIVERLGDFIRSIGLQYSSQFISSCGSSDSMLDDACACVVFINREEFKRFPGYIAGPLLEKRIERDDNFKAIIVTYQDMRQRVNRKLGSHDESRFAHVSYIGETHSISYGDFRRIGNIVCECANFYRKDAGAGRASYNSERYRISQSSSSKCEPKIFISYRRSDTEGCARRLNKQLVARFGPRNIFFDTNSIPYGSMFPDRISSGLRGCDALIAMIGERWLTVRHGGFLSGRRINDPNDFVRIELETAFERELLVVPVLVGGATMPLARQLPKSLRRLATLNAASLRQDSDFDANVDRLISALQRVAIKDPTPDRYSY